MPTCWPKPNAARAEVEKQASRLVRQGWAEHLDAIHKPEQLGFVYAGNQVVPLDENQPAETDGALSAPIAVAGETLGSLVVEFGAETRSQQTTELVQIVARQVSQQIENLRLLESAERYRYEVEQSVRRQTREGWQEYVETRGSEGVGYLYNQNEVKPVGQEAQTPAEEPAVILPLKARDETIGKLSILGLASDDSTSISLANEVAERLGAHIESLRQFEETKRGQFELDKRASQRWQQWPK